MAAPHSRLLAGKADAWICVSRSGLPIQRRGGKVLADAGLCGSFSAVGTSMRAAPPIHPRIEGRMGLCLRSRSMAKVDLKG